jgi:pantoate--beta-alanine ligase
MFWVMKSVDTIQALRAEVAGWRGAGARVGFVATMGALHAGHLSLAHETRKHADRVAASIFVNPKQFGPREDFDRYPRDLKADAAMLARTGNVDLLFAPAVGELFPDGFATDISVGGPSVGLETDFRPHFFAGVATVVAKLLIAAMPDVATFGEKDFQQLLVVRQLARDLGLAIEIVGAPIVREPDGLAMSSRNAYLKPAERAVAGKLNLVLRNMCARVRAGTAIAKAEREGAQDLRDAGFTAIDYVAIRDAETLAKIDSPDRPARVLAAARVGHTRLIDNMSV